MKVLIMGSSGSGKTFLSKEFSRLNVNSVDADEIEGLHGWYNWKNEKVRFPRDADKDFLDNHEFLWDRAVLKDFLDKNPDIYFFGMSGNVFEMLDLFDKVYYLNIPADTILARLDHPSRTNPMGKTDYQKQAILEWEKQIRKLAEEHNIQAVDGTLTTKEILKIVRV